ncbi:MAG: TonB-dependent receptor [Candidatus Marinimicrobia bacterium]|nr:TonB-dependent receptor [Candidatus Neomarinimicrobiota bacterium]
MLKHFILFIIVSCHILSAQGHNHGPGGHHHQHGSGCELTGSVVDSTSTIPIEYVSISLYNQVDELVTGGVTDAAGKFHIHDIHPGKYEVRIEFMGFETVSIPEVKLSLKKNPKKDLGQIKLVAIALELDAVKVIEDKPIFEFETDKMIYNSSDDIIADSGTAEDVLNKVPMVTVDQDGEVSLRGNPNVKILVNDRPNRSGGEVDNIPASLIERVEVITSPSAKYDPEGMAGIINIVLKKGRYDGLNGSIKLNLKHNSFNSIDDMNGSTFYSNYQTDKYNIYSSISLNNRMRTQNGFREVYNQMDKSKYYDYDGYKYDFFNNGKGYSRALTLGSDYSIHEHLKINGELIFKNHIKDKTIEQEYFQDGTLDTNFTKNSSEGDNYNIHLESYFEIVRSYDNPDKEIFFSASSHGGKDDEYEKLNPYLTTIIEEENNYETDFNYKSPMNDKSKIEFGYDGRFLDTKENLNFQLSSLNGKNDFSMVRNIHGFFGEYQLELNEKFSIKPSLRVEFVDKNITFEKNDHVGNSSTDTSIYAHLLDEIDNGTTEVKEINYFPDFHLTYNLTEKQSLQFGISRRIERPGGGSHGSWGQLRPFPRNVYNDSFIFVGKPDLEPEFSTQYEVSYKSPIPMGFFYSNVYFRNITNSIQWYDFDGENDNLTGNIITFRNAESATDVGFEIFTMVMGQTIGGGYNINELNDSSNDYQLNGKNERMNMYMRINLPEKYIKYFSYEFGFYYMKMKVPGGTLFGSKGTLWANTGISKSLFNDRVNLSFSVNNLFDSGGFQMFASEPIKDSDGNNVLQFTDILSSRGGRTFSINLKYHFGEMQKEKDRRGHGHSHGGGGNMDMGY